MKLKDHLVAFSSGNNIISSDELDNSMLDVVQSNKWDRHDMDYQYVDFNGKSSRGFTAWRSQMRTNVYLRWTDIGGGQQVRYLLHGSDNDDNYGALEVNKGTLESIKGESDDDITFYAEVRLKTLLNDGNLYNSPWKEVYLPVYIQIKRVNWKGYETVRLSFVNSKKKYQQKTSQLYRYREIKWEYFLTAEIINADQPNEVPAVIFSQRVISNEKNVEGTLTKAKFEVDLTEYNYGVGFNFETKVDIELDMKLTGEDLLDLWLLRKGKGKTKVFTDQKLGDVLKKVKPFRELMRTKGRLSEILGKQELRVKLDVDTGQKIFAGFAKEGYVTETTTSIVKESYNYTDQSTAGASYGLIFIPRKTGNYFFLGKEEFSLSFPSGVKEFTGAQKEIALKSLEMAWVSLDEKIKNAILDLNPKSNGGKNEHCLEIRLYGGASNLGSQRLNEDLAEGRINSLIKIFFDFLKGKAPGSLNNRGFNQLINKAKESQTLNTEWNSDETDDSENYRYAQIEIDIYEKVK